MDDAATYSSKIKTLCVCSQGCTKKVLFWHYNTHHNRLRVDRGGEGFRELTKQRAGRELKREKQIDIRAHCVLWYYVERLKILCECLPAMIIHSETLQVGRNDMFKS